MTDKEFGWVVGFLEGEGCFDMPGSSPRINAGQKDQEVLKKLQRLFGGSLTFRRQRVGKAGGASERSWSLWSWTLQGAQAAGLMMTIYGEMSTRRKAKIFEVLSEWRSRPKQHGKETHCPQGHPYSKENTYVGNDRTAHRVCRACHLARSNRGWQTRRQQRKLVIATAKALLSA